VSVTVTNLIQGPGKTYYGARYNTAYTTTAEPADALINSTPAASGWTDVGATKDGVTMEVNREFSELEVDQVVDVPDRRLTKREFTMATNFAEPTLELLAVAANEDPTTNVVTTGSTKAYEPDAGDAATQPYYRPILFDGYAPGQFRRRVIVRRMLSADSVTFAYKKDDQTVFTVKWYGHYVSASIKPYKIIDATA
jgi:hypothetical protein